MSAITKSRKADGNLWGLAVSSKVRDLAHRDLQPLGEGNGYLLVSFAKVPAAHKCCALAP